MTGLPALLPVGTQIVSHNDIINPAGALVFAAGAVGVIIKTPVDTTHSYRVRFMDGTETSLKRDQFTVQSQHIQPISLSEATEHENLYQYVVYRCVVGSRAFGLDNANSDTDLRGFYLPPADLHWSLHGIPDQLERGEETYWEIEKFVMLALKANPNILECLYAPLVEDVSPIAQELLDMRGVFVTKLIYQTYNGYVISQFKKLQKHIENHGEIRWKHAMHLIRLLLSGKIALQTGEIPVRVSDDYRDQLLAIRAGEVAWEDVNAWRLALHTEFDSAFQESTLPERPDYSVANDYLIRARRSAL